MKRELLVAVLAGAGLGACASNPAEVPAEPAAPIPAPGRVPGPGGPASDPGRVPGPGGPACDPVVPGRPALRGLDPVLLVDGREVPGDPARALVHGPFTYAFAADETQARFAADPERFAIAFDGACIRMGPLSGRGGQDRFAVHEGRIYLFASDACRAAFMKTPHRFVDAQEAPPAGDSSARVRGAELLAAAVRGIGGDAALAAVRNVVVRTRRTDGKGADAYDVVETDLLVLPLTRRVETDLGRWGKYTDLLTRDGAWTSSGDGRPAGRDVRDQMAREASHLTVALLRAWRDGVATAVALPPAEGSPERVAVHACGATTVLWLEPGTGRVVATAYRGREDGVLRDVVRHWSDFRQVGALTLPFAEIRTADGTPVDGLARVEAVEVDVDVPPDLVRSGR